MFSGQSRCSSERKVEMAMTGWVPRFFSLLRSIEVFDLCLAAEFILISRQAAEEDGAADRDDGGAPAKSVGPGVVIVTLKDQLIEFDWVDDQSDDLDNRCRERQTNKAWCTVWGDNLH